MPRARYGGKRPIRRSRENEEEIPCEKIIGVIAKVVFYVALLTILSMGVVSIIAYENSPEYKEKIAKMKLECLSYTGEEDCTYNELKCGKDCKSLNKDFFKVVTRLGGGSLFSYYPTEYDCLCREGDNTEKLWTERD